jgi:hypothetical protein
MNSALLRFKALVLFAVSVVAVLIIWHFLWYGFAAHHADNPAVQGLSALA